MASIGDVSSNEKPRIIRSRVRVRGFDEPELDFQLVRQLGAAANGGSSIGETLLAIDQIQGRGRSWTDVYTADAERQLADADERRARGHVVSARDQFLKASNSFRCAEYFSPPGAGVTARLGTSARAALLRALEAGGTGYAELSQTFGDLELPGLFLHSTAAEDSGRLLVAVSGFDGTIEETYLQIGAAGLERGWNLLLVAGPGMADTRRAHPDSFFVPDTERWITPWLDQARTLPGIDPGRIAVLGISLGGYFVLRAAAAEPRFAAVVADSPILDLHEYHVAFVGFDPEVALSEEEDFGIAELGDISDHEVSPAMKDLARALIARFGQRTLRGTFAYLREFIVDAAEVRTPTLALVSEEGPTPIRQYEEFLADAGGPVTGHRFMAPSGGLAHCQLDDLRFASAVIYDWLDETVRGSDP